MSAPNETPLSADIDRNQRGELVEASVLRGKESVDLMIIAEDLDPVEYDLSDEAFCRAFDREAQAAEERTYPCHYCGLPATHTNWITDATKRGMNANEPGYRQVYLCSAHALEAKRDNENRVEP